MPMQLHIWAEMIVSAIHSSIEDPPNTTMFVRAGGGTPYKKKDQQVPVAQALQDAVTVIASALFPRLELTLLWMIYLSRTPNSPRNREMLGVRVRLAGMPWSCPLPLIFPSEAA